MYRGHTVYEQKQQQQQQCQGSSKAQLTFCCFFQMQAQKVGAVAGKVKSQRSCELICALLLLQSHPCQRTVTSAYRRALASQQQHGTKLSVDWIVFIYCLHPKTCTLEGHGPEYKPVTCSTALVLSNVFLIVFFTRMSSEPAFGAASPLGLQVLP
jgi:hypothetical protein